jgi:hypothetical protein
LAYSQGELYTPWIINIQGRYISMNNDLNEFLHKLKFILQRKSIRKFKNRKRQSETLNLLIKPVRGIFAGNVQPYSFIVIKDKGT